ncbi:MAG: hypothetical protein HOQ24_01825 [Mycobacteriaceae bacterium]|nr:hypothetical protein [Mycobacteriaceae bacterium]
MTSGGHDPNRQNPAEPAGTAPGEQPPQYQQPYQPPQDPAYGQQYANAGNESGPGWAPAGEYAEPQGYRPAPPPAYDMSGGYPPAPPPPPGGPAGYPGGPGYGYVPPNQFSVSNAIGYAWNKFKANPWPWVVATFVFLLAQVIFGVPGRNSDSTELGTVAGIVSAVVGVLLTNGFVHSALSEVNGARAEIGSFYRFRHFGQFLLAAFLMALPVIVAGVIFAVSLLASGPLAVVLGLLLGLAAIALTFLFQWTYYFIMDRNMDAVTGLRSSVNAVRTNVGGMVLLWLAFAGLYLLSVLTCGLGFFITLPLFFLASAWAYRVTTGGGQIA